MKNENRVIIPEELAIVEPKKDLLKIINNKQFKDTILYEKQSAFHRISVVENEIGRFLHYNDTYQAGFISTDEYSGNLPYINYFLLPYFLNKNLKKILLIGMGTGLLVKQYETLFEHLERIDVVDLEENILDIATKYFNFEPSSKFSFHLQDGRIFLRGCKSKYDLIVVDVANNEGIDARFLEQEYLDEIKSLLKKNGIFVSNLCSSAHFEHEDNKFLQSVLTLYRDNFASTLVFKGDTSDKIYYKSFFNIDERVIDITNLVLISSQGDLSSISDNFNNINKSKFLEIGVDIESFYGDLYS